MERSATESAAHPMRPLRPLYVGIFIAQVIGVLAGLWLAHYSTWFENAWAGAAVLTLPGFAAGWGAQKTLAPAALIEHGNTVRRIGFAAALLSIAVFFMPFGA